MHLAITFMPCIYEIAKVPDYFKIMHLQVKILDVWGGIFKKIIAPNISMVYNVSFLPPLRCSGIVLAFYAQGRSSLIFVYHPAMMAMRSSWLRFRA